MTAVGLPRQRRLGEGGPVARSYRRFLGRASITMFALVLVSAYLLPLLYMVTTAFQQPGQASTPGAPVYPAAPVTAVYDGQRSKLRPVRDTTRTCFLAVYYRFLERF